MEELKKVEGKKKLQMVERSLKAKTKVEIGSSASFMYLLVPVVFIAYSCFYLAAQ